MHFCLDFSKKNKIYMEKVEEINIEWHEEDFSIEDLILFLNSHPSQRINLCFKDTADISLEYLKAVLEDLHRYDSEDYENLYFRLSKSFLIDNKNEDFSFLLEGGVPYYFANMVSNWDELASIAEYKPSDIFITNELGFDLHKVAHFLHKQNIKVRVVPNVAQCGSQLLDPFYGFWIRPEDLRNLGNFIDTVEFAGNRIIQGICFNTYAIQKYWYGNLEDLIEGLRSSKYKEIDSRKIYPEFGNARANCNKKCLSGVPCKICHNTLKLMNIFKEQEVSIRYRESAPIEVEEYFEDSEFLEDN